MTEAPGGSAGFGHGSDPDEHEALLRRIREFLRQGAAWAALEDRAPPEQTSGVAPVLRPSVWTLDWESTTGGEEDGEHRDDEALVLTAADSRTEARFVLADRLVLAHLAADVRGLLAEGQSPPAFPDADQPTGLPSLRVDAEAGFACTGFSIRGLPAIGIQSSRNDPPLAFLVLDSEQLGDLLERARELLGTSAG